MTPYMPASCFSLNLLHCPRLDQVRGCTALYNAVNAAWFLFCMASEMDKPRFTRQGIEKSKCRLSLTISDTLPLNHQSSHTEYALLAKSRCGRNVCERQEFGTKRRLE